jgi:hypothetical protein
MFLLIACYGYGFLAWTFGDLGLTGSQLTKRRCEPRFGTFAAHCSLVDAPLFPI